jgi:hypothetical protein
METINLWAKPSSSRAVAPGAILLKIRIVTLRRRSTEAQTREGVHVDNFRASRIAESLLTPVA